MTGSILFLLIIVLGGIAWFFGRVKANRFAANTTKRGAIHSRPNYHGWYVALWAIGPALLFLIVWNIASPALITDAALTSPAADQLPQDPFARGAILAEARSMAAGQQTQAFNPLSKSMVEPYKAAISHYRTLGMIATILLVFACGVFAWLRLKPELRARTKIERVTMMVLLFASLIATITTIGIFVSLIFESARFFSMVSPIDFLFGTEWNPKAVAGPRGETGFGAIPLFWGTVFIGAIIAMIVAIPLGLMSAIYLTQYAPLKFRAWMKPILEVLAGVPTVVYGYFAALTVAPALRDFAVSIGISGASSESALAAGVVMGIMIIPFVSSMADDSIAAVPSAMRDGSLAMGATKSETIKKVLIPAALPGVVGGVLLAVSRAIGETMIVVMAAGLAANMTANPFSSVTTVTTQIVQLLTGDQEFDSPKTLAAFALGLVLFVVTLLLNLIALRVVKKYREAYE
ncbi:phosphate ABC transporter permease subunit PstC [Parasphingorhabdus litoris]|uniref:Phosphate transport system permease protein n=1 Tax=Parasphingorhabdus litoris TaxID=394733 RepID=A0ABN1A858_9SPHN|nr:phosphate ABC transporter permease subunit PstC [Parasphingorhabdus litoris]